MNGEEDPIYAELLYLRSEKKRLERQMDDYQWAVGIAVFLGVAAYWFVDLWHAWHPRTIVDAILVGFYSLVGGGIGAVLVEAVAGPVILPFFEHVREWREERWRRKSRDT